MLPCSWDCCSSDACFRQHNWRFSYCCCNTARSWQLAGRYSHWYKHCRRRHITEQWPERPCQLRQAYLISMTGTQRHMGHLLK